MLQLKEGSVASEGASVTGAGSGKEHFRLGLSDAVRDTSGTRGMWGLEGGQLPFHQQSGPLALSALEVPSSLRAGTAACGVTVAGT